MKNAITTIAAALAMLASSALATTDVYKFTLRLHVPQVVDNFSSMGKRVYRSQKLEGELHVSYDFDGLPVVTLVDLVNRNYKVNGVMVGYKVEMSYFVWNLIGSNRTGAFKKPSVCLQFDAQPSYVWSYEPNNDNSFVLTLAGRGSSYKMIYGYAAGTQGCGCTDYGHKSPTRVMGSKGRVLGIVQDVAGTCGTWRARYKYTLAN